MKCGSEFINAVRGCEYIEETETCNVTTGPCKRKGKCFDLEKWPKHLTLHSGHLKDSTVSLCSHINSNSNLPAFRASMYWTLKCTYHLCSTVDFAGLVRSVDKELRDAIMPSVRCLSFSCDWWDWIARKDRLSVPSILDWCSVNSRQNSRCLRTTVCPQRDWTYNEVTMWL
jgi:hypothetical protein